RRLSGAQRSRQIWTFTDGDTDAPLMSRSGEKRPMRGTPPDSLPRNERFGVASLKCPVAALSSDLRSATGTDCEILGAPVAGSNFVSQYSQARLRKGQGSGLATT